MTNILIAAIAAVAIGDAAPDVTGTWNMGLQAGHVVPVALVLKQDGKVVTGTIAMPTRASSRCGPCASRTSSPAERSSSSRAIRACRTGGK